MNLEYESLREEIKAWQERRFTVLAGSIALVTGILGLKMVGESKPSENWVWASTLLLILLASACVLTWYARRANAKIAAYLIVFHESMPNPPAAWESRLADLKRSGRDTWDLDRLMIPIYIGLGLLAVLAPMLSHQEYHLVFGDYFALGVAGALFAATLVPLGLESPKKYYKALWIAIKKEENERSRAA